MMELESPHVAATQSNPASLFFAGGRWLPVLRGLLGLLQKLSPRWGEDLAFKLFSTPVPLKWAGRRRPTAAWRAQYWELMGQRLCVWTHQQSSGLVGAVQRPRVLVTHGWGGAAWQMQGLADALWAAGFEPILLDMPAHGHSQGLRTHMPQFLQTLHAAAQRFGPLHGAVGHSLGAVALSHAVAHGLPVQRLALISCSAPPRQVLKWFGLAMGLKETVLKSLGRRLELLGASRLEAYEPAHLGAHLCVPTLLVHDRKDRAAPLASAQALCKALPQASLLVTEGLGHRRILDDAQTAAAVLAHFA